MDNKTLHDTFSVFGDVLSCKVITDHETGEFRGCAYIHYLSEEDAKKAVAGVSLSLFFFVPCELTTFVGGWNACERCQSGSDAFERP